MANKKKKRKTMREMLTKAARCAVHVVNQKAPIFADKRIKRNKTRQTNKDAAFREWE